MSLSVSPGATYGWRARIGFFTPTVVSENNPYEFYLMAPSGVTIVLTSLGITTPGGQETYDRAMAQVEAAVGHLLGRKVDALVQAGVPLLVTNGWGSEDRLRARVTKLTDVPLSTDIGSCIKAMRTLEMSRVVMVTPFDEEMDDAVARYVKNANIEVAAARTLRTGAYEDMSIVPLAVPYRAARELFSAAGRPDGVWITGALMPSVAIIQALEDDLGVPVVTSMQAMTWAGLRSVDINDKVAGYGRLFQVA